MGYGNSMTGHNREVAGSHKSPETLGFTRLARIRFVARPFA
jgi:hypothetical protein